MRVLRLVARLGEIGLAALAIAIAALTIVVTFDFWADPATSTVPILTRLAAAYFLMLFSCMAILFGLRLAVPRLRLPGDRLISPKVVGIFTGIYAVSLIVGLVVGTPEAQRAAIAIALGITIVLAWRSTFKS
jgi:hypothetical protein